MMMGLRSVVNVTLVRRRVQEFEFCMCYSLGMAYKSLFSWLFALVTFNIGDKI